MAASMLEVVSGIRSTWRDRRQSAVAILTLASGLTCVVLVLALVNGLLLRPLPFPKSEELVLAGTFGEWGSDYLDSMSQDQTVEFRARLAGLAEVAGFQRINVTLSDTETRRDYGAYVSANLFRVLGVGPLLGRDFNAEDEKPGATRVAAISEQLWRVRYEADPNIIGRVIRVNAEPVIVASVMPGDFSFPTKEAVWMPSAAQDVRYDLVLRRAEGVGDAAIVAALQSWLEHARRDAPEQYKGKQVGVGDMRNVNWGSTFRGPLRMMFASAILLLLLACTSVANILLARMSTQYRDIVVRIALGATWRRILALVLVESAVFSVAAATLALLLTSASMSWLIAWFRANDFGPAHWQRFDVDWRVLAITGGVAAATVLLTALPAALRACRTSIAQGLRDTGDTSISRPPRVFRAMLLVQVALSCASLVSVAMMVRAIALIDTAKVGIRDTGLLTSRVVIPVKKYSSPGERREFLRHIRERLAAEPGIADVSISAAAPGTYWSENVAIAATTSAEGDGIVPTARSGVVDRQFFDTFGVVLREGRLFAESDGADHPRVAVVDQTFAKRFSPDEPIVGRELRVNPQAADAYSVTVVGVVNDLKLGTRLQPIQPAILFCDRQSPVAATQTITVRVNAATPLDAEKLDRMMQDVDRDVPLAFSRYEDVMLRHTNTIHFFAHAFYVVGIVALVLAGSGLYGVVMVTVSRRTREIGLKRSLGARDRQIVATILGELAAFAAAGTALGLLAGIPIARALDASLIDFGGNHDPAVLGGAIAALLIAAIAGATVPVVQALRVDPARALKAS